MFTKNENRSQKPVVEEHEREVLPFWTRGPRSPVTACCAHRTLFLFSRTFLATRLRDSIIFISAGICLRPANYTTPLAFLRLARISPHLRFPHRAVAFFFACAKHSYVSENITLHVQWRSTLRVCRVTRTQELREAECKARGKCYMNVGLQDALPRDGNSY